MVYVLTGPTAGQPPGTGAVQKYWNRGLPFFATDHYVSFLPVSVPRGRFVGVRTLRRHSGLLLRQQQCFDVAASLMSAVAAATIFFFFGLQCWVLHELFGLSH